MYSHLDPIVKLMFKWLQQRQKTGKTDFLVGWNRWDYYMMSFWLHPCLNVISLHQLVFIAACSWRVLMIVTSKLYETRLYCFKLVFEWFISLYSLSLASCSMKSSLGVSRGDSMDKWYDKNSTRNKSEGLNIIIQEETENTRSLVQVWSFYTEIWKLS